MSIDQKDVTSTICEYINTENTTYAILLSGLWGSGKTYYWKNELQEKIEDAGFSTLYISLNGLDKTEQIARKIVTSHWKSQSAGLVNVEALEKHKGLLSGTLSNIGSIAKNLSSVAGIANSLVKIDLRPENMIDYIDFKEKVICFDDLERWSDITKALGFINDFVEHKKTKVLILANEEMIRDKLSAVKEKVVGKTIKFAIDKKVILTNIINSYPEEVRDYFLSEIDLIIKMMECSESCNYRVVRTILDDFYNIYQRSKEQPYFHAAKTPLLKYALAVGLEIRVKGIKEEEKELIRKTSESAYISWEISRNFNKQKEQEDAEPYNIVFKKRYYSNDFEGRYLFHSVFDYIDFGYLDTTKFIEEMSRYEEKELTALQFLMSVGYWKMSDADFEARVKSELLNDIEMAIYKLDYIRDFLHTLDIFNRIP